jgi:hypothetical protein
MGGFGIKIRLTRSVVVESSGGNVFSSPDPALLT